MPHISQQILIVKFIIIVLQSNWFLLVRMYVCLVVLGTTFNNISVISWQSVLLVEESGENHRPVASHWQTLSHNVVHLALIEIRTHNISGDRNIGIYEFTVRSHLWRHFFELYVVAISFIYLLVLICYHDNKI
jgi:hypothetical protein